MADGFLGRWAQRKAEVRSGQVPIEPDIVARPTQPQVVPPAPGTQAEATPPLPTLEDANALRVDSDFKPFAARGVDPIVRNAAMKKLFADPHFNVMDRLDTYIDDYSQPDPLSAATLRQMASAQFLKLFDEEKTEADSPLPVNTPHDHPDLQLQQIPPAEPPGPGECTE